MTSRWKEKMLESRDKLKILVRTGLIINLLSTVDYRQ